MIQRKWWKWLEPSNKDFSPLLQFVQQFENTTSSSFKEQQLQFQWNLKQKTNRFSTVAVQSQLIAQRNEAALPYLTISSYVCTDFSL